MQIFQEVAKRFYLYTVCEEYIYPYLLCTHAIITGQARFVESKKEYPLKRMDSEVGQVQQDRIFWILCQFKQQDLPLVPLLTYFKKTPEKERLFLTIEEIAADYVRQIRQLCANGPYYLGGYSVGGLMAIETARQLQAAGEEVAMLFLLDPHLEDARENRRPFLKRMWGYYRSIQRLRNKDKIVRIVYLLAHEASFLSKKFRRKAVFTMFRIMDRMSTLHRLYHIVTTYRTALAGYSASAYHGRTIIYFRRTHPLLPQSEWRRFCSEAEIYTIDTSVHEETLQFPWNSQWQMKLRQIMA